MKKLIIVLLICILCLGTCNAFAMSEEHAREIIRREIPDAMNAVNTAIFLSKEYDGAFVVVINKHNKDTSSSSSYWYITDEVIYLLGQSKKSWNFGLIGASPEVFYNTAGKGKERTSHACALINNKPINIENADKIYEFANIGNSGLIGLVGIQDYDYAFLRVDLTDSEKPVFAQIRATELTRKKFTAYKGAKEIINTLKTAGYSIESCLYWDKSAVALNCTKNGAKYHVYAYTSEGKLTLQSGWWGDEYDMHEGFASPIRDLDMAIIETE